MGEANETASDVQVLREDDPRCAVLEANGYRLVGQSWGARLRLSEPLDLSTLREAVAEVQATGITVRELGADFSDALYCLESQNHMDYPFTPATAHELRDRDAIRALWTGGGRIFGALDGGRLVGATVVEQTPDRGETRFTSVLKAFRGRGIGKAIKAASILALTRDGVRLFGTGGAGVNDASLGANRALGYTIEERWHSYKLEGRAPEVLRTT